MQALIEFMAQAHKGITGLVIDEDTNKPIPGAKLKILGRNMEFRSAKNGEYYRILLPGKYSLVVSNKMI